MKGFLGKTRARTIAVFLLAVSRGMFGQNQQSSPSAHAAGYSSTNREQSNNIVRAGSTPPTRPNRRTLVTKPRHCLSLFSAIN